MTTHKKTLITAGFAAIGASACCIGPLLLLSLGVSGTWISSLTAMEPYSLYFIFITVCLLCWVFYKLYITQEKCNEENICADRKVLRNQRIIFWIVSCILLSMITFQYYAQYIID
ncbi:mercuric transporter MerT family protein [Marinicella litoralis]|uniref:Mercuric transport protein MerT n=1 Tax=Marinicella litoralis TaxID=644220 RepID=A0A4R6XFY7_9GAMM|nr:mercuric ion transport protein [Marinicella litoralis]